MLPDVSQKKHYVREKFSRVTRRYDLVNTLGSLGLDHFWRWRTVRELKRYPGPILDLCAGTLTLTQEIVRQRPRMVMALDLTYEMLSFGAHRLKRHPACPFIFCIQGDAERLPFRDASFYAATVAFGIRNLAHLEEGLHEVWRVLKPGGKFVILEFSRPKNLLFAPVYRVYLSKFMPFLGGKLTGDREAYEYLARSIAAFLPPQGVERLLKATGFEGVYSFPLTLGVVTVYAAFKPRRAR